MLLFECKTQKIRELIFWERQSGVSPVIEYLSDIERENKSVFMCITTMIRKLAKDGMLLVNGKTIKKLQIKQVSSPVIEIKKGRLKCRIYTLLTGKYLFVLHGEHKKTNKTPMKTIKTIIHRSKDFITSHHYEL